LMAADKLSHEPAGAIISISSLVIFFFNCELCSINYALI
jgi:hypothetical protein